jgi:hypothetical protein
MAKRRLMSLEELMAAVENALDCSAIEVDVFETQIGAGGYLTRSALSSDPLHRLTKCLRSYGLLNEYTTAKESP